MHGGRGRGHEVGVGVPSGSGADNPVIHVAASTRAMLLEMTSKRMGATAVIGDHGDLLGLVTDYDVRHVLERGLDLFAMAIVDVMNPRPSSIFSDEKATVA